jgi:hypothetical protein
MLIQFTLSVNVDAKGKDDEYLSDDQSEGLHEVLNDLEEVLGKHDLELNDSGWEEI